MPRIESIVIHQGLQGIQGPPSVTPGSVAVNADELIRSNGSAVVAIPAPASPANQLAPSITGLRWRRGDYVTPADFGGVGDGVANDYTAIMTAYAALGNKGGTLNFLGRTWYSASTLTFSDVVHLDGGGAGISTNTNWSGALAFPAATPGVVINGEGGASVRNLTLIGGNDAAGTADGLTIHSAFWRLDQVMVTKFNRHGIHLEGDSQTVATHNVDEGVGTVLRAIANKGDGIRITGGGDANVLTLIAATATGNGGYGINNRGSHNVFVAPTCTANGATVTNGTTTVTADYRECGNGNTWINPYAEGGKAFVFDTNPAIGGAIFSRLVLAGNFGAPAIWSGRSDLANFQPTALAAVTAGCTIEADTQRWSAVEVRDPAAVTTTGGWVIGAGIDGGGQFNLRSAANAKTVLTGWSDATKLVLGDGVDLDVGSTAGSRIGQAATRKLAFWGKTPVVQPSAYTNSSGVAADKTLAAYTSNPQSTAYTGAADGEAKLADLNALRVAYETLRTKAEDDAAALSALIADLKAIGLIG